MSETALARRKPACGVDEEEEKNLYSSGISIENVGDTVFQRSPSSIDPRSLDHETHLSAQQDAPQQKVRLSRSYEDPGWPSRAQTPQSEGKNQTFGCRRTEEVLALAQGVGGGIAIATLRFEKKDRIRKRPEIDRVFDEGKRYSCRGMRLHVAKNGSAITRVVFITVRSYPGAVERNRAKRLLRECWRQLLPRLLCGFDVVVILFPGSDELEKRREQLRLLLAQAGLFGGGA